MSENESKTSPDVFAAETIVRLKHLSNCQEVLDDEELKKKVWKMETVRENHFIGPTGESDSTSLYFLFSVLLLVSATWLLWNTHIVRYLDVFDATAHQTVLLKRIPADIKDLEGRRDVNTHIHTVYIQQHTHTPSLTLSECPVAVARIFPLFHSQIHTVFLASRPTEANRCRGERERVTNMNRERENKNGVFVGFLWDVTMRTCLTVFQVGVDVFKIN